MEAMEVEAGIRKSQISRAWSHFDETLSGSRPHSLVHIALRYV